MQDQSRRFLGSTPFFLMLLAIASFFVVTTLVENFQDKRSFPPPTFTPGPAPALPEGIPDNVIRIPVKTEALFANNVNEQLRIRNQKWVTVEGTTIKENSFNHDCECIMKLGAFTLYLTQEANGGVFIEIPSGWELIPSPIR